MTAEEAARTLETDIRKGINEEEAADRLKIFGLNVIEKNEAAPWIKILLNQFKSPLILILLAASIVTIMLGHLSDAMFILSAVVINTLLGFYQEFKAEKALAELKTYIKERARVIRGGVEREIEAALLVPGDIIRINQGDRVPADGRLIFVNDLQVDEAVLTGESLPELKNTDPSKGDVGVGDQNSMIFAGTLVTQGIGTAIVCRTDFSTELGKIALLVSSTPREATPLQSAIRKFSAQIGVVIGIITVLIFGFGLYSGYSFVDMFLTSVAIAVSAVPEGLPIALTVILAVGVQRMARRKGVVRKLVAAETLGSATVIITDKTGTLTQAKMELSKIIPFEGRKLAEKSDRQIEQKLLEQALLNTDVLIENRSDEPASWRLNGRIIETALVRSASLRGLFADEAKQKYSVLSSLPFNAVNKFSASLIKEGDKKRLILLGAPEMLIKRSGLTAEEQNSLLKKVDELANSGELVLALAEKDAPKDMASIAVDLNPQGLNLLSFMTLRDPIRPTVKDAVYRVQNSGIKLVIMTGDHRGTAEAVAKEAGIKVPEGSVIDISEFRNLSDDELKKRLPGTMLISRVSPVDKMRVAKLYQEMGETVAMTGDGVNDAPSLRQADIGIAMGSGTEVARDVSDIVLLDDNFETIAAAVNEGRQIMSNVRKAIVYLLADVADHLFLIGGSLLIGIPLPLNALQILWVNFFSDSFPAVAYGFERGIDSLSDRPQKRELFDPLSKFLIIGIGFTTSATLFSLYWVLLDMGYDENIVRTFIFASFGSYTLFKAFSLRSFEKSIFQIPFFSNPYLVIGSAIGFLLMGSAVYMPFLQGLLGTVALPPVWLLGVLAIGAVNITAVEICKAVFRKQPAGNAEIAK